MKRLLMALCLIFAVATAVNAKPLTMEQVLEGTCRVAAQRPDGKWSTGTGTCIADDPDKYWIFTNGHVVNNNRAFKTYFFRNGYRSKGTNATLVWKSFTPNTNVDFALLTVPKKDLGYFKPRIIPLADENAEIKRDTFFMTGTCPMGLDALVRKGRVYATENWRFYISEVLPGQSGSGVLINVRDRQGELQTRVGGIITWRISMNKQSKKYVLGGVIPIKVIRTVMAGKPYRPRAIPSNFMNCNVCLPANADKLCAPDGRPFLDAYVLGGDGRFYLKNLDGSVNVPVGTTIKCWFLRRIWQARPGVIIPRHAPRRPLVPVRPYCQPGPRNPYPCDPIRPFNPGPAPAPAPAPAPQPNIPGPAPIPIPLPDDKTPTPAPPRPDPQLPVPDNPAPLPIPGPVDPEPETTPEPTPETLPPYANPNLEAELQSTIEERDEALRKVKAQAFVLMLLKAEIEDLAKKYENSLEWKDKYGESHKKLMEARQQYDVLVGEFNATQSKLAESGALVDKFKGLVTKQSKDMEEIVDKARVVILAKNKLELKTKTVTNHRNVATGLLGILGIGVLSYVGRCWYKRRGKAKIDKVQDVIEGASDKAGLDGDAARDIAEKVEAILVGLFNKRFPEHKATPPPLPTSEPAPVPVPTPEPTPIMHPDYRQPPPPIEPMPIAYVMANYDPKQGQGPVPPEFPGRLYDAQAVLNAVDEVAKRHPDDARFSCVPQLVRQILGEPRRQ